MRKWWDERFGLTGAKRRKDWLDEFNSIRCIACGCHAAAHRGAYLQSGLLTFARQLVGCEVLTSVHCRSAPDDCLWGDEPAYGITAPCWGVGLPATKWQLLRSLLGLRWWRVANGGAYWHQTDAGRAAAKRLVDRAKGGVSL